MGKFSLVLIVKELQGVCLYLFLRWNLYSYDVDTYVHTCSHQTNQYTCVPLEFRVHYNMKINPFESWG